MNDGAGPSPGFRDHPEHKISVEPFTGVVVVTFGDVVIASSARALVLKEADYAPVFYLPFEDIYFEFLSPTETKTTCPFKGEASYWQVSASNGAMADVMWAYQHPYDEMRQIKDHSAFYSNKVRIESTPSDGPHLDL